jgi:hypothetical protein
MQVKKKIATKMKESTKSTFERQYIAATMHEGLPPHQKCSVTLALP